MADASEVFSWMELSGNIYPAGGSQTAIVYAEDVEISVRMNVHKEFYMNTGQSTAQRTKYTITEKDVTLTVGKLFTGPDLFKMFNSATSFNVDLFWGQTGVGGFVTTKFNIWSAVMSDWRVAGREGEIFRSRVVFNAADISGI